MFLEKLVVTGCGRNGFSWLGGKNITVLLCVFADMGRGRISTEPCAGIDIESESVNPDYAPAHGNFMQCTIRDNAWLALAAGAANLGNGKLYSKDMQFINCLFAGNYNSITDIESPGYRFDSCQFYGQLYLRYNGPDAAGATRFNNCNFSNRFGGQTMFGDFLILNVNAPRTNFFNCRFTAYGARIFNMDNSTLRCGDFASYPVYNKCTFNCYLRQLPDKWINTSGLGSKTSYRNNRFYFNKDIPFLTDESTRNMCAQDLGGNQYFPLTTDKIPLR